MVFLRDDAGTVFLERCVDACNCRGCLLALAHYEAQSQPTFVGRRVEGEAGGVRAPGAGIRPASGPSACPVLSPEGSLLNMIPAMPHISQTSVRGFDDGRDRKPDRQVHELLWTMGCIGVEEEGVALPSSGRCCLPCR